MTDDEPFDNETALHQLRAKSPGEYLLKRLGESNQDRLIAAMDNGVPIEALVVAARWWQLETYLRLLVYIQLRALLGPDWQTPLKQRTLNRAAAASDLAYMASADDDYLLAHTDVSVLFELITTYWKQCQHGIGLPEAVWQGTVAEIVPIRHRIAHCRRPHDDDVARIEQLLRDLEPGANRALRAYVDWREVNATLDDPVVKDWVGLRNDVAHRLVPHGAGNKGIHFTLMASRLPWAESAGQITGTPGWFWVIHVVLDGGHMYIDDYLAQQAVQALLPMAAHIIEPWGTQIVVTIPGVGDPDHISKAIGGFFEAIFVAKTPGDKDFAVRHQWRRHALALDPRVDAAGLLSVLSGLNDEDPITIFSAR